MATTPEQIDLWLQTPSEHQHLEFKEAKKQFGNRKLYEYCVALANEGGGRLLLGISNKPPRSIVGTQAFNDPIAMVEKLFQALGFPGRHRRSYASERASGDISYTSTATWYGLPLRRQIPHALR